MSNGLKRKPTKTLMREINSWEKVKLATNPKKCVNKGIQWWVKCEETKVGIYTRYGETK